MQLAEQYRPRTFDDVAGQPAAVAAIRRVLKRGWGGRAWWITGLSGTGKTTLARLIAQEGAAGLCTLELQACDLTPKAVRETLDMCRLRPLPVHGLCGWCVIVNECHKMPRHGVTALLDALDAIPDWVVWVFTTTKIGQQSFFDEDSKGDAAPLVSRCIKVTLSEGADVNAALARRAKETAVAAGMDGLPDAIYAAAIQQHKGNLRAVYQAIESGQLAEHAKAQAIAELATLPLDNRSAKRRLELQELVAQIGG
jgi:replication-associated recombination protein RarA